jgi:hypothetical protein
MILKEANMRMTKYAYLLVAILIPLIGMTFCGGCKSKVLERYPDDNMVEEVAESMIENLGEELLDLPDGSLDAKIDLSFRSPE